MDGNAFTWTSQREDDEDDEEKEEVDKEEGEEDCFGTEEDLGEEFRFAPSIPIPGYTIINYEMPEEQADESEEDPFVTLD